MTAYLTTCYADFTHKDGGVAVERLWYFLPSDMSQRRFLGLCENTSEAQAMATAEKIAATAGDDVRRLLP